MRKVIATVAGLVIIISIFLVFFKQNVPPQDNIPGLEYRENKFETQPYVSALPFVLYLPEKSRINKEGEHEFNVEISERSLSLFFYIHKKPGFTDPITYLSSTCVNGVTSQTSNPLPPKILIIDKFETALSTVVEFEDWCNDYEFGPDGMPVMAYRQFAFSSDESVFVINTIFEELTETSLPVLRKIISQVRPIQTPQ